MCRLILYLSVHDLLLKEEYSYFLILDVPAWVLRPDERIKFSEFCGPPGTGANHTSMRIVTTSVRSRPRYQPRRGGKPAGTRWSSSHIAQVIPRETATNPSTSQTAPAGRTDCWIMEHRWQHARAQRRRPCPAGCTQSTLSRHTGERRLAHLVEGALRGALQMLKYFSSSLNSGRRTNAKGCGERRKSFSLVPPSYLIWAAKPPISGRK